MTICIHVLAYSSFKNHSSVIYVYPLRQYTCVITKKGSRISILLFSVEKLPSCSGRFGDAFDFYHKNDSGNIFGLVSVEAGAEAKRAVYAFLSTTKTFP